MGGLRGTSPRPSGVRTVDFLRSDARPSLDQPGARVCRGRGRSYTADAATEPECAGDVSRARRVDVAEFSDVPAAMREARRRDAGRCPSEHEPTVVTWGYPRANIY